MPDGKGNWLREFTSSLDPKWVAALLITLAGGAGFIRNSNQLDERARNEHSIARTVDSLRVVVKRQGQDIAVLKQRTRRLKGQAAAAEAAAAEKKPSNPISGFFRALFSPFESSKDE